MHVAILGLGEAGRRYAEDLITHGWEVSGYDPAPAPTPRGLRRAESTEDAVGEADIVLSLTGARFAEEVAQRAATTLRPPACFADFNSASPATKQNLGQALADSGAAVADVAVLAPVPRLGAKTPLLVSGSGAEAVAAAFRRVGAEVETLPDAMGAAAECKLLRSVFMKGLAATVLEAVTAGSAAGREEWIREQIAGELGPDGRALVDRLVDGTRTHATRRLHEMRAGRDFLAELGTSTAVCDASISWLEELSDAGGN